MLRACFGFRVSGFGSRSCVGGSEAGDLFFFFFFTLGTGPRRSLDLKLRDARVFKPQIRAHLGTGRSSSGCPHWSQAERSTREAWMTYPAKMTYPAHTPYRQSTREGLDALSGQPRPYLAVGRQLFVGISATLADFRGEKYRKILIRLPPLEPRGAVPRNHYSHLP